MANKITYASMKLKRDDDTYSIPQEFNGKNIEVLKYLPIIDKYALIEATIDKATERDGYINPLKLEMFFELHLVYMYSNITFTEKQKENEERIYDVLKSNFIIEMIKNNMTPYELEFLRTMLNKNVSLRRKVNNSTGAALRHLVDALPVNAEAAANIVNGFDPEQFSQVMNFAKTVGFDPKLPKNEAEKPELTVL